METAAVQYACHALTRTEAYRYAYNCENMDDKTVNEAACRLFKRSNVAARVRALVDEMRVEDIVSGQKIVRGVISDLENARADKNWTAVAALNDKLMKYKALMTDRVVTEADKNMSDEELIQALSGGNQRKERLLRQVLATDGFAPLVHEGKKDGTDG